jgi:putative ABC transport system permease protein
MNGILQDLRYAVRMWRCNPGFSAAALVALALGIGANTAVFTVVNGVLLRPLPFPDPERLLFLAAAPRGSSAPSARLDDREYLAFRRADRLFEAVATFEARGVDVSGAGEPARLPAAAVTADYFRVLGVSPALGRTFVSADEGARTVVIGAALWRERFAADPQAIGTEVRIDGVPHTIAGVMPPGFSYPEGAQAWLPLTPRVDPHVGFLRPVIGRAFPDITARAAQAELQAVLPPNRRAIAGPLREMMVGDVRRPLLIFDAAVGFVLLIACANVANLLLIRTAARRREIAIRGAIGASARRLTRQLLTESVLLALLGGAAGLLLATWGVPLLLALAPEGAIPRAGEIRIDRWALAFTVALSAATGLLFGAAPLPHAVGRPLRETRSGNARAGERRSGRLRDALAVFELALALVLLAGGGLMLKSFLRAVSVDPGYQPRNVLAISVSLPEAMYRTEQARLEFQERVLEKLAAAPGVAAVGAVDLAPLGPHLFMGDAQFEGGAPRTRELLVEKSSASPGYFRALGIRLLRGREFDARDRAGAPGVAIVSQSVARRAWPGEDPIGKRLSLESRPQASDWLTVVGVVDEVRQFGPTEVAPPQVYRPFAHAVGGGLEGEMTFVARTAIDASLIAPSLLRRAIYEVERTQAVASIGTMQERIARSVAERVFQTRLLGGFAAIALLLAAVGIYSVLACSVAERTREIGIRIALGAAARDIMGEVLRRSAVLTALGVAAGTAGAFATTRALASLLFEVKPADPAVFAMVAALLGAVAVLAAVAPARRATAVDPVIALRHE